MSKKHYRLPLGISAVMFFSAILLPTCLVLRSNSETRLYSDGSTHSWVQISYRELVDMAQLAQSGRTVRQVLDELPGKLYLKSELQPFLEPFSALLPEALDLINGPAEFPRYNVADMYPYGSAQPAWAAIARGGKIIVTDDGNGRASVFVPGSEPEAAYKAHYSVLRHMLVTLLPPAGTSLEISVYAYRNDYALCRLSLNTKPFELRASEFPPLRGKRPLDLVGFQHFFDQQPELAGAAIDGSGAVVLVGRAGNAQTLAGRPIQISDLAVAYRAVFHAGYNKPFVSLDSHLDPTLTKVNFGGFLEDTHIGAVVLEADKRFKTISSGLDPNSFVDIRTTIRKSVPDFATASERDLGLRDNVTKGWVGTRFWYYPDSVEVITDTEYQYAVIGRAQFEADAERSREDYATEEEFERFKKTQLSPSIRSNIDHLNENYDKYVVAFPELKEFSVVARLMGICVWLDNAKLNRIDLDSLLAAALPPCRTPRERSKFLAVTRCVFDASNELGLSDIQQVSSVTYLGSVLNRRLEEVFPTNEHLARYLALADGAEEDRFEEFSDEAIRIRRSYEGDNVRRIIGNENQLKTLLKYAAHNLEPGVPQEHAELEDKIHTLESEIERIKGRLNRLSVVMSQSTEAHNQNVDKYNRLVEQQRRAVAEVNSLIDQYNARASALQSRFIMEIGGGVGLDPSQFDVRVQKNSPALHKIQKVVRETKDTQGFFDGEKWLRTRPYVAETTHKKAFASRRWDLDRRVEQPGWSYYSAHSAASMRYWHRTWDGTDTDWRDQLNWDNTRVRKREYSAFSRELVVEEYYEGQLKESIVGSLDGRNLIVFRRRDREHTDPPQDPPSWWPISRN